MDRRNRRSDSGHRAGRAHSEHDRRDEVHCGLEVTPEPRRARVVSGSDRPPHLHDARRRERSRGAQCIRCRERCAGRNNPRRRERARVVLPAAAASADSLLRRPISFRAAAGARGDGTTAAQPAGGRDRGGIAGDREPSTAFRIAFESRGFLRGSTRTIRGGRGSAALWSRRSNAGGLAGCSAAGSAAWFLRDERRPAAGGTAGGPPALRAHRARACSDAEPRCRRFVHQEIEEQARCFVGALRGNVLSVRLRNHRAATSVRRIAASFRRPTSTVPMRATARFRFRNSRPRCGSPTKIRLASL